MKYALVKNNIVVQIQPDPQENFIEVANDVVCDMVKEGAIFKMPIPRPLTFEEKNSDLLTQLLEIDLKSIRALREGDQVKIDEWETKAVAIRARFKN